MKSGDQLTLALLGKTGHGKSSTANTILRNSGEDFETSFKLTHFTKIVRQSGKPIKGDNDNLKKVTVYDTPGLDDETDTNLSSNDKMCAWLKRSIRCIEDVLKDADVKDSGVDSFVLVFGYNISRFTQEVKDTLDAYKKLLGENVFSERGIIVFTHGDEFKSSEETPEFRAWCDQQSGPMKGVFEECKHRIVLVYNLTEDTERRQRSADEIIRHAFEIKGEQIPYAWPQFEAASETRKDIYLKYRSPSLTAGFVDQITMLTNELTDLLNNWTEEGRIDLLVKIKILKERIEKKSQGRNFFQQQLKSLKNLEQTTRQARQARKQTCILS